MSNSWERRIMGELKRFNGDKEMKLALVNDGDLTKLIGSFIGFENTPYEGGKYEVSIEISSNFPFAVPKAKFLTRVWHPNISSATGFICLDLLRGDKWLPSISIKNVLTSIQTLLLLAEPDDPQDAVVASQYISNKELYNHTAFYWNHIFAGGPEKSYFKEMDLKVNLLMISKGIDKTKAIHKLSMANWEIESVD